MIKGSKRTFSSALIDPANFLSWCKVSLELLNEIVKSMYQTRLLCIQSCIQSRSEASDTVGTNAVRKLTIMISANEVMQFMHEDSACSGLADSVLTKLLAASLVSKRDISSSHLPKHDFTPGICLIKNYDSFCYECLILGDFCVGKSFLKPRKTFSSSQCKVYV